MLCITGPAVRVVWVLDVDGEKEQYKVGTHTSGKPSSRADFFFPRDTNCMVTKLRHRDNTHFVIQE